MRAIPYLSNYHEHLGKTVFVYWNLHKKCWSVRHKGRVLFHAHHLRLEDCLFKVSEKGRQRVLSEGKKYVHAGVQGKLSTFLIDARRGEAIGYNPKRGGTFFAYEDGLPIYGSAKAIMNDSREVIAI